MGINFDEGTKTFTVKYSRRHPTTGMPSSWVRKGIKTKVAAEKMFHELIRVAEQKFHETIYPTWVKAMVDYIENCRNNGHSEKTIYCVTSILEKNTATWNKLTIDKISTQDIRKQIYESLGDTSASHQRNLFKAIKGVFEYCVECGYLQKNPVPQLKFRIGDKIKKVLTESQVKAFLEHAERCNAEWFYHWVMALYTGMRNGELYALTWDKVNFETRQMLVDTSWTSKTGFKSTKSGNDRIVEIAPQLLAVLKKLKLETCHTGFVLPRNSKWDKGEQARELRMYLLGMGLPTIRFHDLRATWATILISKKVDPITVMKMGGWEDMKTMMKYIRKAGVDIRGSTDCLELFTPAASLGKLLNFSSVAAGSVP